jgi:hypothetical protein
MDAPHQTVPGWMRPRSSSIVQRFPITGARIKHRYATAELAQFLARPTVRIDFRSLHPFRIWPDAGTSTRCGDLQSGDGRHLQRPYANRRYRFADESRLPQFSKLGDDVPFTFAKLSVGRPSFTRMQGYWAGRKSADPPCNMKIRYKMKTTLSGCSGRSRFLQLPLGSRYWLPMLKNSLPGGPKLIASDPHFLERLPQTEIVRCNDISLCHRA